MQLIIFGPPGAGKDTFSKMIEDQYGLYHFCMGNELRLALENNIEACKVMGEGNLVPNSCTYEIAERCLSGKRRFLLNGFPRNISQCLWLEGTLQAKIDVFIDLQVNKDVLIDRLIGPDGRGRSDDTVEVVSNRLKVFEEQTSSVGKYFRARTNYIKIDGNPSVDEVYSSICEGIDKFTSG